MVELGYWLSSEEHAPADLVRNARRAEEVGFPFALISDHFHPWIDRQGHAPFVWAVLGGIAQATSRLRLGTAVTCPTMRIHPAIIAQAGATAAALLPDRFFLGLGAGESLNEHILGEQWPEPSVRREMLEEAIDVIRMLWQGGKRSHYGEHFTVQEARIYDLPERLPPVVVAASGRRSAETAGRLGDGAMSNAPSAEMVRWFEAAGGAGKPCYGQIHVCWAQDEAEARRRAFEYWPLAGLTGGLFSELRLPSLVEEAAALVREADVTEAVVCGPDPEPYAAAIDEFAKAGFDHVGIHQIGPDQEGFFRFCEREILPRFHR
ncbi:MAG: TIGR03557 family F420-dependent LLM class oxidoreductase [Chloroflexi bacterium]|nr:TIGR03557 family F420-dependent LLM class oxidoreductase [Chloroflexota bacterium]